MNKKMRCFSHNVLKFAEHIGLLIIAIATLVAVGFELVVMFRQQMVTLADLLLLFIYLEVLAMVSVYLNSGKLPIRMPLYIAIVALARYLILDMKNLDTWRMLGIAGATLLIALTILIIRYGHTRFPYNDNIALKEDDS